MDLTLVVALYSLSGILALALRRPLPRLARRALHQPPLTAHQERVLRGSLTLWSASSLVIAAAYALHWGTLAWSLSCVLTVTVIARSLRAQTPRPHGAMPYTTIKHHTTTRSKGARHDQTQVGLEPLLRRPRPRPSVRPPQR